MKPHKHPEHTDNIWLALEIGNSRLHWALFVSETLYSVWDTDHLPESVIQQLAACQTLNDLLEKIFPSHQRTNEQEGYGDNSLPLFASLPPLLVASVVPSQTAIWQSYPNISVITLDQIPLKGVYPTLGIDRALALWGAGKIWGFPILVIDAGTALTFTAADANECLVGGAILPGLGLQFATLGQQTGQLPLVEMQNFLSLPIRFALNTTAAIQSGVIYTILAGIKDFIEAWWQLFPNGKIAIKGGDGTLLINYLQALYPEIADSLIVEQNLIFWGMREITKLL
ncbi:MULTISPECIES: pantothenate kinase [Nostoc]|uniref:Type III pantothenate kinase n=2 Tax=Nostoc TaxID=1177 RepID=A0ABR8I819_9NOSO|nr:MULTISPECIES: pantothenate kinase [Nostoc]MBD2562490.1 pantothenate kinase [Nostoc linckia FACHB-391]MBD2647784.1 pantothenate kinase [Nostoc foliaceum FACHB-393]